MHPDHINAIKAEKYDKIKELFVTQILVHGYTNSKSNIIGRQEFVVGLHAIGLDDGIEIRNKLNELLED